MHHVTRLMILTSALALSGPGCATNEDGTADGMSADQFATRYADALCSAADFAVSCTSTAGCTVPADGNECRSTATQIVNTCFAQTDAAGKWLDLELAATECLAAVERIDSCEEVGLRFEPACTELTEVAESEVRDACLRMIDLCDSEGVFFPYMFRRL